MARVAVIGTGLVGASVGLALVGMGDEVAGYDSDAARLGRAKARGAVTREAGTVAEAVDGAELVVAAVPVAAIAGVAAEALSLGAPAVTDVGSAKSAVVRDVEARAGAAAARFVGGHPMAGSEQDDLDGADAALFSGATWVLTPTRATAPDAFTAVRTLVRRLGAEPVAVTPEHHDELVALVSHVPQLAATTLMDVAAASSTEHATLLRLAAGGFRDMTRIAAGSPAIWPDICAANRDAILEALDRYLAALGAVRELVAERDGTRLLDLLQRARVARRNLPRTVPGAAMVELRVPVPDRPGVLAEVTTLAGRLGVNISDLEIAHSLEAPGGVLVMVVGGSTAAAFEDALVAAGYHPARSPIE